MGYSSTVGYSFSCHMEEDICFERKTKSTQEKRWGGTESGNCSVLIALEFQLYFNPCHLIV